MQRLHLNVVQGQHGTQAGHLACAQTNEFHWNADFTAFRIVPLNWWNDASYAAYQARDTAALAEDEYQHLLHPAPRVPAPAAPAPVVFQSEDSDDILF